MAKAPSLGLLLILLSGLSISTSGTVSGFIKVSSKKEAEDVDRGGKIFQSKGRKLINSISRDVLLPAAPVTNPTVLPVTNPTVPPVVMPPDATTPTIVTIPGTGSPPLTPTPVTDLPITPVPDTPVPITTPATATPVVAGGTQPVTNPVTTPAPGVNVPLPTTAPSTTSPPAVPGQAWCVAKNGVQQSVIQAALDYACGIGGADCASIQPGANCYNPNTLQNHASYAFNSYYQRNPTPTSCDFGGAATLVSSNPSSGSCIYPASSPSAQLGVPLTSTPSTIPITSPTTLPITSANGGTVSGTSYGGLTLTPGMATSPPTIVNQGNPGLFNPAIYGSDTPPGATSSTPPKCALGHVLLAATFLPLVFIFQS